jgi:hypothetical protein
MPNGAVGRAGRPATTTPSAAGPSGCLPTDVDPADVTAATALETPPTSRYPAEDVPVLEALSGNASSRRGTAERAALSQTIGESTDGNPGRQRPEALPGDADSRLGAAAPSLHTRPASQVSEAGKVARAPTRLARRERPERPVPQWRAEAAPANHTSLPNRPLPTPIPRPPARPWAPSPPRPHPAPRPCPPAPGRRRPQLRPASSAVKLRWAWAAHRSRAARIR